jgi:pimeloyl-ACP methyl ester carboxylesterase
LQVTSHYGASFGEREVEADGFRIRYLEAGKGEPVVYFHGGGGLHMSGALDLLAERFRVLAFELPGFGDSPENTRTQSLDELAETMTLAVQAVGVEQPYNLVGTSFGAATALRLALAHQDRLSVLILESPAAFRPEDAGRPLSAAELQRALFAHPERAFAPAPPEIMGKQLALLGRLLGPLGPNPELEARLSELTLPVLVLFGRRDGLIAPSMGGLYKRLIVNSSLVFVYDAAHEIQFDRPEAYAGLVADFVERQEAFVVNAQTQLLVP